MSLNHTLYIYQWFISKNLLVFYDWINDKLNSIYSFYYLHIFFKLKLTNILLKFILLFIILSLTGKKNSTSFNYIITNLTIFRIFWFLQLIPYLYLRISISQIKKNENCIVESFITFIRRCKNKFSVLVLGQGPRMEMWINHIRDPPPRGVWYWLGDTK